MGIFMLVNFIIVNLLGFYWIVLIAETNFHIEMYWLVYALQ